jgi:hypothetical protein
MSVLHNSQDVIEYIKMLNRFTKNHYHGDKHFIRTEFKCMYLEWRVDVVSDGIDSDLRMM